MCLLNFIFSFSFKTVLFSKRNISSWVRNSQLSRLHGHTQTHTHTYARTHTHTHTRQDSSGRVISPTQGPLPDNTQHSNRQTSMPLAVFEPAFSASLTPRGHLGRLTDTNLSDNLVDN
jgi:hypothetical protein